MTYHNWIVFFDADTWKKTAPMIREDGPRYFRAWVKLVPLTRKAQKMNTG
jgi:protein associated with RNAse G/E